MYGYDGWGAEGEEHYGLDFWSKDISPGESTLHRDGVWWTVKRRQTFSRENLKPNDSVFRLDS